MFKLLKKAIALSSLLLFACCRERIPDDMTSLVQDPGPDPGPSPQKLSLVWHHHSTGDSLLKGGLLAALQNNNVDFYDINYTEAKVDDYVIGDKTDSKDFPKNFNTPKFFEVIKRWELSGDKKQHDIIMFKSCYPASNIESEAKLEQYKEWYSSLLPTFKAHPDILFIAMSTPPLVRRDTTADAAKRARNWSKWITQEWGKDTPNVKVFDLFNALAVAEGKPNENTLVPQFSSGREDSHPSKEGSKAVTRMFIPWFNRIIREAGLVK